MNELVLVDASINGQMTPALFKADRNGFFYVLNRKTGQLISAKPYVHINWAKGLDGNGRPTEAPEKRRTGLVDGPDGEAPERSRVRLTGAEHPAGVRENRRSGAERERRPLARLPASRRPDGVERTVGG